MEMVIQLTRFGLVHGQCWISLAVKSSSFLLGVCLVKVSLVTEALARLFGPKAEASRSTRWFLLLLLLLLLHWRRLVI